MNRLWATILVMWDRTWNLSYSYWISLLELKRKQELKRHIRTHRIIKYPRLEGIHKVRVQLLAPQGVVQKSDHIPEHMFRALVSIFDALFKDGPNFDGKELPDVSYLSLYCLMLLFLACVKLNTSSTACGHTAMWLKQASYARHVNSQHAKEGIKDVPVSKKN